MLKVFIDANIFFASAGSPTGGSSFVLELAKRKKIKAVTVSYALAEAERNISNKLGPTCLSIHHENILEINPEIQSLDSLTVKEIYALENIIAKKDIPILAGALFSKADILLTLDKKDLLNNPKLKRVNWPFVILNPENFIKNYL